MAKPGMLNDHGSFNTFRIFKDILLFAIVRIRLVK